MSDSNLALPSQTVVPDHIAIILDGNRRWARARGLKPWEGHYHGYIAIEKLAKTARKLGVHTFTVWAFSTENWERSKNEIDAIMNIFRKALKEKEKEFHRDRVALVHLGRKDRLPEDIRQELTRIEADTAKYAQNHVFNLAVDYGGRDEIVRAAQKIVRDGISADEINEKTIEKYLDTQGQPYPNPDLFIRTSGEQRTSGLLPWQMAYSEFYFEPEHLPDFTPDKLKIAILDYSRRRRRFGGNDAIEHLTFKPELVAKLELKWWRLKKIPEEVGFVNYAANHFKEQFGLSKKLALDAARLMAEAFIEEKQSKWERAGSKLRKFYKLIKDELKLAFEPKIVASLEVRMRKENWEGEDATREFLAEVYRISLFQAAKAAHLRVLANIERNKGNWDKAEDYLQKYYRALKERVA
jgi:undecaprenyl diphosphate synthase